MPRIPPLKTVLEPLAEELGLRSGEVEEAEEIAESDDAFPFPNELDEGEVAVQPTDTEGAGAGDADEVEKQTDGVSSGSGVVVDENRSLADAISIKVPRSLGSVGYGTVADADDNAEKFNVLKSGETVEEISGQDLESGMTLSLAQTSEIEPLLKKKAESERGDGKQGTNMWLIGVIIVFILILLGVGIAVMLQDGN